MEKLDAEQTPDSRARKSSNKGWSGLTDQELTQASGGDGPPGTAGDGNGRVAGASGYKA